MLSITDLTIRYGDELALEELSLSVDRGEFVTLLGPSGCGKTTTLLAIAGHVAPTSGTISLDGTPLGPQPPEDRSLGLVFQQGSLFPHMTARENIAYALGPHDYTDRERRERTDEYLSLVGMSGHADSYPDQLSGGQRRRIELARALVYEPDVLLLDEPLSGLDRQLRQELQREIVRLHEETSVTTLYVTHDQSEALTLSDRIVVLENGQAVATGSPRELYEQPPTPFVARFLGAVSTLPATVVTGGTARSEGTSQTTVEWCGHRFVLDGTVTADTVSLYVRPEAVSHALDGDIESSAVTVTGTVVELTHSGSQSTLTVETPDGAFLRTTAEGFPAVHSGSELTVGLEIESLFSFAGGQRLAVRTAPAEQHVEELDDER